MNKKLLVILTIILVMAFAVPAFANLTGIGIAKDQTPAAYCPNAGNCVSGAACGTGNCAAAVQQGCGGGGCGGGACASAAQN